MRHKTGRMALTAPVLWGCVWTMACLATSSIAQSAQAMPPQLMSGASTWLGITDVRDAASALRQPLVSPLAVHTQSEQGRQGASPQTCQALLGLESSITGTVMGPDWTELRQMLAKCHALQALSQAKPATHTALPTTLLTLRDTRLWPVDAWPAISPDEEAALKRPGLSLRNASGRTQWQAGDGSKGRSRSNQPMAMQLSAHAQRIIVQWIARGDFNSDGLEDWLLLWRAKSHEGSWQDTRAALLTRASKNEAVTLLWLEAPSH